MDIYRTTKEGLLRRFIILTSTHGSLKKVTRAGITKKTTNHAIKLGFSSPCFQERYNRLKMKKFGKVCAVD